MITEAELSELREILSGNPPAPASQLEEVSSELGDLLTEDYSRFFSVMNGAEGDISGFGYVRLWSADEVVSLNRAYCSSEFLTDVILIGTDGGDEAYGLARRDSSVVTVCVPFIPMEDEAVRVVAGSFSDFLRLLISRAR